MICKNCGTQVSEGQNFCEVCGNAILTNPPGAEATYNIENTFPPVEQYDHELIYPLQVEAIGQVSESPKKKHKNKKLFIIIASATLALIIIAAILIVPLIINKTNQKKYDSTIALLSTGDYAQAKKQFIELGDFEDAQAKAEYCENKEKYDNAVALLDAGNYTQAEEQFTELGDFEDAQVKVEYCQNKEKYKSAVELLDSGDYVQAKEQFVELGDFEDAQDQVENCDNIIAYEKAEELLTQKKYDEAAEAFEQLGDFRDSIEKVKYCENSLHYLQAEKLFESGDYTAAKALYGNLPEISFPDATEKYSTCVNKEKYKAAETLYSEGSYYDAYLAFLALGSFEDAEQCMAECVQSFPYTGEQYRNPDYAWNDLSLMIVPPDNDQSRNYIKIYTPDDVLVSTIAIDQGATSEVFLPQGSYRIRNAYGTGDWFGEADMFGDEGTYLVLINSESDNDLFNLEAYGIYTLYLRSADDVIGDPVDSEYENRDNF